MIREKLSSLYKTRLWAGLGVIEGFVLRNGAEFTSHAPPPHRDTPKECFKNATLRASCDGLRYVEGFALRRSLGIPLQHAWNLDADGRVVDYTWNDQTECEYFGVEFSVETVIERCLASEYYGVLHVREKGDFFPWLLSIDPRAIDDLPDMIRAEVA